ncbi:hypothetical protein M1446_03325 [Candidatus Dependentiae bacterium]|nr:hypothetical protein [Candidatus Dependentiae bacterium]
MLLVNNKKLLILLQIFCFSARIQAFLEYYLLENKRGNKLLIISDDHKRDTLIRKTGQKMFEEIFKDLENKDLPKIKFVYESSKSDLALYKEYGDAFLKTDPRGVDQLVKLFMDYNIKYENSNFPIEFLPADPREPVFQTLPAYFLKLRDLLANLMQKNVIDFKNSDEFIKFKEIYSLDLPPKFSDLQEFLDFNHKLLKIMKEKVKNPIINEQLKSYETFLEKYKEFFASFFNANPTFNQNSPIKKIITKLIEEEQTTSDAQKKRKYLYEFILNSVNKFYVDAKYFSDIRSSFLKGYKGICVFIGLRHARHLVDMFLKYHFKIIETNSSPYFDAQALQMTLPQEDFDTKLLDDYLDQLKKTFYKLFEKKEKTEGQAAGKEEVQ